MRWVASIVLVVRKVKPQLSRVIVGLILLATLFAMSHYAPKVLILILAVVMTYAGGRGAVRRFQAASWPSKRRVVNIMRGIRKSFGASPLAMALYATCLCVASIALAVLTLTHSSVLLNFFGFVLGGTLCAATIVDWYARLGFVLSIPSVAQTAKWVMAFLATATVFLSTVMAKQLTHSIAQADPASMPEFVRLVTAMIFPYALAAVISVVLSFLIISQAIILFVGVVLTAPVVYIASSLSPALREKWADFGYRVLNGKKPPRVRPWWDRFVDGIQYFLRPVGTGAIAGALLLLGTFAARLIDAVPNEYLQILLVNTEYRRPHLCDNVPQANHIAYLQGGYVSVATPAVTGFVFSIEKCHK